MLNEHQEQALLMNWCEVMEGAFPELKLLYAIPNGGVRHIGTAKKLKAEGVKPGVPDLCLPVARKGFHGLFSEMKRGKGGRLSDPQKWWAENLTKQGYRAVMCQGMAEAKKELISYLQTM